MSLYKIINYLIAAAWLINGFFCKVLHLVPRHEFIVARILGDQYAKQITITIGVLEIGIAIWIITDIKKKLNAVIQIVIIAAMNILEFILAPDLLLWGRWNLFFALLFISLIYYNKFILREHKIMKQDNVPVP